MIWTYQYDGLTRRNLATNVIGTSGQVAYYYNKAWKCVEERFGLGSKADVQFVYGVRGRNDLVLRDRNNDLDPDLDERHYALSDAMMSVTAIATPTAVVQERYSYSAFGQSTVMDDDFVARDPNESDYDWQVRFHGEYRDVDTGHYNYGYRYFLPKLGKWPSRDPIGEEGGLNPYGFVGNDGVNLNDRLGLIPFDADLPSWGEKCSPKDAVDWPCKIAKFTLDWDKTEK